MITVQRSKVKHSSKICEYFYFVFFQKLIFDPDPELQYLKSWIRIQSRKKSLWIRHTVYNPCSMTPCASKVDSWDILIVSCLWYLHDLNCWPCVPPAVLRAALKYFARIRDFKWPETTFFSRFILSGIFLIFLFSFSCTVLCLIGNFQWLKIGKKICVEFISIAQHLVYL